MFFVLFEPYSVFLLCLIIASVFSESWWSKKVIDCFLNNHET